MTVEFLPQARTEWAEAIAYYNEQRSNLGYEFALEIDRTVARILQHPLAWTLVAKRTRRALVDRFPYGIFLLCSRRGHYRYRGNEPAPRASCVGLTGAENRTSRLAADAPLRTQRCREVHSSATVRGSDLRSLRSFHTVFATSPQECFNWRSSGKIFYQLR